MEKIHSLTGMIDLIGHKTSKEDISERIFYAEEILRDIFESYSISEIRTPALESSNLFKRSVGDASDIVNKELYSFLDKNEKSITLRPEGTASVIRSVIEKKLDNDKWIKRQKNCRQRIAKNFTLEKMVTRYDEVWSID